MQPLGCYSDMEQNLHSIRTQYTKGVLDERAVSADPVDQLSKWLAEALDSQVPEPTAMVLATASPDGRPSSRVVLLKGMDPRGVTFFTNYESRKGRELGMNPFASLLFFWPALERQIRIEGKVTKVSEEESDEYFHSRPEQSRLSAVISPQSQVIPGREWLEERRKAKDKRRKREEERPAYWGGYRLEPYAIEFWQGRQDRLHDRIQYSRDESGWKIVRLAP